MNSTIKALLDVQEIDRTIHKLKNRIEEFDANILIQEKSFEKADRESEKFASNVIRLENDKRDSDLLIEEKTDQINALKKKNELIKTAKEQKALEMELNTANTAINKIEDRLLSLLADIDKYNEELETSRNSANLLKSKYEEIKKETKISTERIMAEINGKKADRIKILEDIDDYVTAQYENINKWAEGNALAELKTSSCLGCFLILPPQVAATAAETDQLSLCPNCGRILYIVDD